MTGHVMDGVYLLQDQSSGGSTVVFDDVTEIKYSSVNQKPAEGGSVVTFEIVNKKPSPVIVRTSHRVRTSDLGGMCTRDNHSKRISYSFDQTTAMRMSIKRSESPDFLSMR